MFFKGCHTYTAGFFLYFRQYLYLFQNIMGIILDLFIVVLTDHLKMTTSLMVGFLKMTTFWKPNSRYYHKIWRNCSQFYLNINSEDEFMKGWFFFLFRLQPWFWVSLILMLILRCTAHYVLPIQSKKVIAFLQAKVHLKPDYLILGYKGRGGVGGGGLVSQNNSDE